MPDRIDTPFTNEHFAAWCLKMAEKKSPYWYGSCVYRATSSLLSGHGSYGVNAISTLMGIGAAVVVYFVLVIVLRILRAEDLRGIPKGDKIIKLLHLK